MMLRLSDWRPRLNAALGRIGETPFAWGENDCFVGLAAAAVEAITGVDFAAVYRGRYHSLESGLELLAVECAPTLDALVGRFFLELPLGEMRVGDLAAIFDPGPFGCALGVCNGERLMVLRPEGIGTLDRRQARRAFKVGE